MKKVKTLTISDVELKMLLLEYLVLVRDYLTDKSKYPEAKSIEGVTDVFICALVEALDERRDVK